MDCNDFILTPCDKIFNEYSFHFLQHAIHGKYEKEFSGLHLLTTFNKEITNIKQTGPEDKNGVWEAEITVKNSIRNKEYKKVSTLFPKSWTPTHFMFEIYDAFNKIKIVETINAYRSTTTSGIPVIFSIMKGKARSVYPEYIVS